MSKEAVHTLLKKAEADAKLRDALEAALQDEKTAVRAFLDTATKHGCEFTARELVEVLEQQGAAQGGAEGELDEQQLDAVAGGAYFGSLRFPTTTYRLFRSYSTGPTAGSLGDLGGTMEEEEELIQM
jgi:hypothetical protein